MPFEPYMGELVIRPLSKAELPRVAELHALAFPESMLTALGREVLERYYAWLLEGPHDAELMGAWQGHELAGFCAAGVFRGAMSGFLRENRAFLVARVLARPSLLLRSSFRQRLRSGVAITVRFSRRLSKLGQRSSSSAQPPPAPAFGVLSIATSPEVRGRGVGRALMLEAEARARAQGFKRMTLTVHPENTNAVRFYQDLGWIPLQNGATWNGAMQRILDQDS